MIDDFPCLFIMENFIKGDGRMNKIMIVLLSATLLFGCEAEEKNVPISAVAPKDNVETVITNEERNLLEDANEIAFDFVSAMGNDNQLKMQELAATTKESNLNVEEGEFDRTAFVYEHTMYYSSFSNTNEVYIVYTYKKGDGVIAPSIHNGALILAYKQNTWKVSDFGNIRLLSDKEYKKYEQTLAVEKILNQNLYDYYLTY